MDEIKKDFQCSQNHGNLKEVLLDHSLASLGDAYINFVYSLALSAKTGRPTGAQVKGSFLADAIRKAGLREFLPSRMTRHDLADAAEALVIYAWLHGYITIKESVRTMAKTENTVEGLSWLLKTIRERITFP